MKASLLPGVQILRNDNDEKIREIEKHVKEQDEAIKEMKEEIKEIRVRLTNLETLLISSVKKGQNNTIQLTDEFIESAKNILLKTDVTFQTEGEVPIRLFRSALIKAGKLTHSRNQDAVFNEIIRRLERLGFEVREGMIIIPDDERSKS